MDPKLSNLDPKLQDAYNRVMGGSVNNTSAVPPQSNQMPQNPQPTQTQPNQTYQSAQNSNQTNNTAPAYPPPPADPAPGITPPAQFADSANANASPNPNEYQRSNPVTENRETPPDILSQSIQVPISSPQPPEPNPQVSLDEAPPPSAPPDLSNNPAPIESTLSTAPPQAAMPSSSSTIAFNAENSSKNIGTTPIKKGGLHVLPLIIGLGVVLLLLAYTFVWILIFNVEVPFLPAF